MSTDFAFAGTFVFKSAAELAAFVRDQSELTSLSLSEHGFVELHANKRKKEATLEGFEEKSIYGSDVAPLVRRALDSVTENSGRGELVEIDTGGLGERFSVDKGLISTHALTEDDARAEWASPRFSRVRARLERYVEALRAKSGMQEVPAAIIATPKNIREARRALQRAQLSWVGATDGLEAARLLLDRDPSAEAVDIVLDAIERKWAHGGPPMMLGSDEAIIRSLLVHHAHPHIAARARTRLAAIEDSGRSDRAAKRVCEGLRFLFSRRAELLELDARRREERIVHFARAVDELAVARGRDGARRDDETELVLDHVLRHGDRALRFEVRRFECRRGPVISTTLAVFGSSTRRCAWYCTA